MKNKTKLLILNILIISFISTLLLSCSKKHNEKIIIEGSIVSDVYQYNIDGFMNTPYGKITIFTQSYFKNGKLYRLLCNRANGFLEYSIEDLRKDTQLYNSLNIDSLFIKNEEKFLKYKISTFRNDTTFYKDGQNVLIYK